MIPFEKALNLVIIYTPTLPSYKKDIYEINSEILAENIRAKVDLPAFSNSAMDGFALRAEDTRSVPAPFKIKGCIRAGDTPSVKVGKGEACKIMTGAPLPVGADAVIMVEDTEEDKTEVLIKKSMKKWENIRLKGEEIKKGRLALKTGTCLNPAAVGFLSAMGWGKVRVFRAPRVALLFTGSELVRPGRKLEAGKIWESNSALLNAVLAEVNIKPIFLGIAKDNMADLEERIREGLKSSDVLLISGGISVGEYDLVQEILLKLGIQKIFWRAAIKPGKPTFFGRKGNTLVFGLPGNPASVLVTYLQFVRPAIQKMKGQKDMLLEEREAILEEKLKKKPGRAHFLRGVFQEKNGTAFVKSAGLQYSHILESFSKANCLIFLEEGKKFFKSGERVKIQILPWK